MKLFSSAYFLKLSASILDKDMWSTLFVKQIWKHIYESEHLIAERCVSFDWKMGSRGWGGGDGASGISKNQEILKIV